VNSVKKLTFHNVFCLFQPKNAGKKLDQRSVALRGQAEKNNMVVLDSRHAIPMIFY